MQSLKAKYLKNDLEKIQLAELIKLIRKNIKIGIKTCNDKIIQDIIQTNRSSRKIRKELFPNKQWFHLLEDKTDKEDT